MRRTALDGLTRLVALVLAGMMSLSILGAVAAMSEGRLGPSAFPIDTRPAPPPPGERDGAAPREAGPRGGVARPEPAAPVSGSVAAAPAPAPASPELQAAAKWLEVIGYVLFALAFVAALIALILWRASRELGRAADALEALAARDPIR
jgi:hypothetical protein